MITTAFDAGYKAGTLAMVQHISTAWPVQPASPYKRVRTREAWQQGFKHAVQAIRAERERSRHT